MTSPTHVAFGNILLFCLAKAVGVSVNPWTASFCSFGACLPDIDTPTSVFGRVVYPLARWIEGRVGHRTFTHSLLGWLLFGVVFLPIWVFVNYEMYIALMIGIISHNIIDMVNTTGVTFGYPCTRRWVFPYIRAYPTKYRIQTGSGTEFILLGMLVILLGVFYPVGQFGFRRVLHVVLGNPQGAVCDYRTLAADYKIVADIWGIDRVTSKHFSGTYPVLGSIGNTVLVIRKEDGNLYTIGLRDDTNFVPKIMRCKTAERVSVIVQDVDMASRAIGDIQYFLDSSKEQYLYGALKTAERVNVPYNFRGFNTIFDFNGYLMFNVAIWEDIKKADILDVYVVNGKLTIKTFLKNGETIERIDATLAEANKKGLSNIVSINFKVDRHDEIFVKKGDKVEDGQILGRSSIDMSAILAEIKAKEIEKQKVSNLKDLEISKIDTSIKNKKVELRGLREEEKKLKELVDLQVISQNEYQKNLEKQQECISDITKLQNLLAQEKERYDIQLLQLSQQICKVKREKKEAELSTICKSNVAGIVTSVSFGPSGSKMPVTIKILTDVNTE